MSPLTKTFTVIVTILAIVLVALVIPFVANTNDLQKKLQDTKVQLRAAQTAASMAQQEVNSAQAQARQQIQQYTSKINELTSTQIQLRQKLQDAQAKASKVKSRVAALQASYTQLAAASKLNAKLLAQITSDLKASQNKVVAQAKKMVDLDSHNQQLQARLDSLNRQVRQFSENLHNAKMQTKKYKQLLAQLPEQTRKKLSAASQINQVISYAPVAIAGRVTHVQRASPDLFLAQINIGSQDNVKSNMRFMIYKNGKLLGFLLINKVDDNAAVGRVQALQGKVQTGDKVLVPAREG